VRASFIPYSLGPPSLRALRYGGPPKHLRRRKRPRRRHPQAPRLGASGAAFIRCLVVIAAVTGACGGKPATGGGFEHFEHHGPIILITIDTLRADRVGLYGSTLGLTPHIDRLATSGRGTTVFASAIAQVPLTLASHATILTGLHPARHGIRTNDGFRLPSDVPTLPAVLKAAGYATGGFVGGYPLNAATGIGRGFDQFDDEFVRRGANERRAGDVIAAALPWIREHSARDPAGARVFAWIHLFDPHSPYDAPAEFAAAHPDAPYDAEVAYTDAALGTLFEALSTSRILDTTLLVIVADHGESLGEHGERTHGTFVYDATIHVPLIVRLPQSAAGAGTIVRRATVPVETADLAPTIAAIAGVPLLGTDGVDLRPLLNADTPDASTPVVPVIRRRAVYAESYYQQVLLGWSALRAVRGPDWKFIEAPAAELYNLQVDPRETVNVITGHQNVARAMELLLPAPGAARTAAWNTDAATRLRSLGYVTGRTEAPTTRGADPKDKIAVWDAIETGIDALTRDPSASRAAFARALRLDPGNGLVLKYQGDASFREGRLAEAADAYRRAIAKGFKHPDAFINLASIAERQGRADQARAALAEAVKIAPGDADAWNRLGQLELHSGQLAAARDAFNASISASPGRAEPQYNLGIVERRAGNERAAQDRFRHAIESDPRHAEAHYELGTGLLAAGRADQALDEYRAALAERSDYAEALFGAARSELALQRWDDARRDYEHFVRVAPPAYAPQIAAAREALRRLPRDRR
jgi:choline-sulfatase